MLNKPKRVIDKEYLESLRTGRCIIDNEDCWGDIVPAHIDSAGSGGSDYSAVRISDSVVERTIGRTQ